MHACISEMSTDSSGGRQKGPKIRASTLRGILRPPPEARVPETHQRGENSGHAPRGTQSGIIFFPRLTEVPEAPGLQPEHRVTQQCPGGLCLSWRSAHPARLLS